MLNVITLFSDTHTFIPHGHCYLWKPELVSLHLLSDGLIALAYYSIPFTLFSFVRKRRDLPFSWLFLLFSAFIVACGTTHLLAIWTLWHPTYWLSGGIKLLTACVSVATAVLLVPIVPQVLALPSPSQLELANQALQQEIAERQRIQTELTRSRDLREAIFNEAADALFLIDPQTLRTLDCNRQAVDLFQAEAKASLIGIEGHTLQLTPFTQEELSANVAAMQLQGFWSQELEYVTCRGNRFWGNVAAKSIVVAEQVMHLVRVTDISEHKQAEAKLRQSQERLQLALEASGDGLWDWHIQAKTVYRNPRYFEMLGYAVDDLPSQAVGTWESLVHPDDVVRVKTLLAAYLNDGADPYCVEYRLRTKTGAWKWIVDYAKVVARDEQGNPLRMIGTHRDIDDRKQAEQSLQEQEAFLRAIGDNIPNGYIYQLMRELDGRYRYTYVSAGIERVSGLKPDEILADSSLMFKLVVEEDLPYVLQKGEESAQNLSGFDIQVRERLPNGDTRWLRLCSTPRRLEDGRVVWDGIRLDINDLKQTEETLRQSETCWQLAVTGSNDGIWDHNLRTGEHYLSPRCFELLGYELDEIDTFDKWVQYVHPDDAARLQTTFQAHIDQRRSTNYACEYRMRCKDGSTKWLLARGQVLWDEQKTPLRAVGSLTDISDRKRAEAALSQSEARNRALIQALPDLLIRMKQDGTYLDIQQTKTFRLFNPRQTYVGNNIHAILPAAIAQKLMEDAQRALQTRELQVYEYQLPIDGDLQFEEVRIVPCAEDEVLLIVRDVTDRRQTEESLRRYERIISATTDAISLLDRNYVYQVVNQAYLDWYDKRQDEVVGHPVSEFLPPDVYQTVIKPRLDQCLAGRTIQYEMWADYAIQGSQFLSVTYDPDYDSNGSVVGIVVSLRNITRLKQAEVQLELQSLIVRNMAEGVCLIRVSDGVFVYANPKFEHMFGYNTDELIGQHVSIVNYEDRNTYTIEVYDALATAILEQGRVTYEVYNAKKDGTPFWCQATTNLFEHPTHGAVFVVVQQDITDQKQAQDQLRDLSNRLTLALKSGAIGIWDWNITTNKLTWDERMCELYGMAPDQFTSDYATWVNCLHPDDRPVTEAAIQQALAGEKDYEPEFRVGHPDGTVRHLKAYAMVKRDQAGVPQQMIGINYDITELKQSADRIEASLKEKEVLLQEIHHRVKNNLGIVDGLLHMQLRRSSDPEVIAALKESQNRIASIALVHEKLYGSDNLANIDFAQYITDLTAHLFNSYSIDANRVKLTMQIEPIALDLDAAIPCGLIINELVSNALKYAFPNTQGGEIRVSFQPQPNHTILFSVSDNGIGLPPDLSLNETKTLGITLVRGLVKQLQGTIEMNAQAGITFTISFGRH